MAVYACTGGTGSLGRALTIRLLKAGHKVRSISRDEHKIAALEASIPQELRPNLSCMIGHVQDRIRMTRAFDGSDYVIHAAAMKEVPRCEYDPEEAIRTNVDGTVAVANACIDAGVKRAVLTSTDKAACPVTLYGYTKAVAERAWLAANRYSGGHKTLFCGVRYGNVFGSAGSVVHVWKNAKAAIPVTDRSATRFHITLDQAVTFVLRCLEEANRDELWIPKIPAYELGVLADAWGGKQSVIGLRNGEKPHESLISIDESCCASEFDDHYVLTPGHVVQKGGWDYSSRLASRMKDGRYQAVVGSWQLTKEKLREVIDEFRRGA